MEKDICVYAHCLITLQKQHVRTRGIFMQYLVVYDKCFHYS